jgi:hypothetical protein
MRTVSARALQAMLAQESAEVFLVCLTIAHPTFAQPYLLVNDYNPLVRTAGTFTPFAFDASLPNEQDDQLPQPMITIDNVDNEILKAVRTVPMPRPTLTMEVVLASSPNTVEAGPFEFSLLSAPYNDATIQGSIGFEDDFLNTAFPAATYTPVNSKGLFL